MTGVWWKALDGSWINSANVQRLTVALDSGLLYIGAEQLTGSTTFTHPLASGPYATSADVREAARLLVQGITPSDYV